MKAIAFDPLEQRVYWSDVEESRIYRQFLNGTKTEIFLEGGIGTVDGMAIDPASRLLFFTNIIPTFNGQTRGKVESVLLYPFYGDELPAAYRRVVAEGGDIEYPRGITLNIANNMIYFTDWGSKNPTIFHCRYDGSRLKDLSEQLRQVFVPLLLTVVLRLTRKRSHTPCVVYYCGILLFRLGDQYYY